MCADRAVFHAVCDNRGKTASEVGQIKFVLSTGVKLLQAVSSQLFITVVIIVEKQCRGRFPAIIVYRVRVW